MERFSVAILTASDSRGEREDESGRVIKEMIAETGGLIEAYDVVPDNLDTLCNKLIEYADVLGVDLILTTGGTGLGPRDNTPEATLAVIEKLVPGMAEAMRSFGLQKTPHAMISRAVCGVRGETLIVNLPGSPKAVKENLGVILPAVPHAIHVLSGKSSECAALRKDGA